MEPTAIYELMRKSPHTETTTEAVASALRVARFCRDAKWQGKSLLTAFVVGEGLFATGHMTSDLRPDSPPMVLVSGHIGEAVMVLEAMEALDEALVEALDSAWEAERRDEDGDDNGNEERRRGYVDGEIAALRGGVW